MYYHHSRRGFQQRTRLLGKRFPRKYSNRPLYVACVFVAIAIIFLTWFLYQTKGAV
jgi:hypothetical protein